MVLPVADDNPTRRRAFVTGALVIANIATYFLLEPTGGGCQELAFLWRWAAVPRELLSLTQLPDAVLSQTLGRCAALVGQKSVIVSAFTAMFLHANLTHLLGNMLFLWVFGNNVEDRLGHGRFVVFYVVGGLVATYAFAVVNASAVTPLLGASGAIAAVLGAYLVLFPRARVHTYVPFPLYLLAPIVPGARIAGWFLIFAIVTLPAFVVLGLWFVLQVFSSSNPAAGEGVAYVAHVGGFLAGIVLVWLLADGRAARGATGR